MLKLSLGSLLLRFRLRNFGRVVVIQKQWNLGDDPSGMIIADALIFHPYGNVSHTLSLSDFRRLDRCI